MCGGIAPESRRHELFATITEAEADRLEGLTGSLVSVDQAIAVLGEPDSDLPRGMRERTPARGTRPPKVVTHRLLLFKNASNVADIVLTDHGPDGIRFSFHGKYLRQAEAAIDQATTAWQTVKTPRVRGQGAA
jgi:hypothetical protein